MNATNIQRLKWRLSQSLHWLWRFRSLPRAERLFDSVAPGTILARRLFGYTFYGDVARSSIQRLIYLDGKRFIPEASLIRSFLKPGFHVIDVGANIGYYTLLLASAIGENGSIVAIEPSPENLRELYLNVERNNLTSKVEVVEAAVGDKAAVVGLRTGINSGVTDGDKAAYQVPMDTIDNIVKRHVDFMKIDIEGFEVFALRGATRVLTQDQPTLFVEIHPKHLKSLGSSSIEVVDFLRGIYRNIRFYEQGSRGGFLDKLLGRYLKSAEIREVLDPAVFFAQVDQDEAAMPFWAICKPNTSAAGV